MLPPASDGEHPHTPVVSEQQPPSVSAICHSRLDKFLGCLRRSLYNAMCLSFEYETFLHVLHGKQYDKQVQGGSVHIIEPGTLCVSQKPKALCEVLKEGKIKRINNLLENSSATTFVPSPL